MRKNCGHTKIRRFKGSANARAPRYSATAAQPAASKRRSLWPLTRLPSNVAGRICDLVARPPLPTHAEPHCISGFPRNSREMAAGAAPPMPDNTDDDAHATSKNIEDFCEEITGILYGPDSPEPDSQGAMPSRRSSASFLEC